MGNKSSKNKENKLSKNKENILWLDYNVNNKENSKYQDIIINMNKFNLLVFKEIKKCLLILKEISLYKNIYNNKWFNGRKIFQRIRRNNWGNKSKSYYYNFHKY